MSLLSIHLFINFLNNLKGINLWLLLIKKMTKKKKKLIRDLRYQNFKILIPSLLILSWIHWSLLSCLNCVFLCVIGITCLLKLEGIWSLLDWNIPLIVFPVIKSILFCWLLAISGKVRLKKVFLLPLPYMLYTKMLMLISWR